MARFFVSGSSQKIVSTNLPAGFAATWAAGQAITMACWHMPTQNTANADMLWIGNPANAEDDIYLEYAGGGSAGSKFSTSLAIASAGVFGTTANAPDGVGTTFRWHHSVGTYNGTSGTNSFAFSDGNAGTGQANTKTPSLVSVAIGCSNRSVPRNFYAGWIALPAIWNVVLSNNEIMALARGAWPGSIRPQNLVFFLPDLNGQDAYDAIQHNPLTVTGATFASNNLLGKFYNPPKLNVVRAGHFASASSAVNVSIAQVAATVTATGGTQSTNVNVTQVAATVTASGGTQTLATVNNVAIAQLAASVTATGGTQSLATVNDVAINQLTATVTATGETQTATTNASVSQLAANVTASGGTQVLSTINNVAITQVAGTVTASGGTQDLTTVQNVALSQVAGTVTATGGTQALATVNDVTVTQLAASVIASGGTQTLTAQIDAAISQLAALVTAAGGTQSIFASTGSSSVSIAQLAGSVTASGGTQITQSSTGPVHSTKSPSFIFLTDGHVAVKLGGNVYLPL